MCRAAKKLGRNDENRRAGLTGRLAWPEQTKRVGRTYNNVASALSIETESAYQIQYVGFMLLCQKFCAFYAGRQQQRMRNMASRRDRPAVNM